MKKLLIFITMVLAVLSVKAEEQNLCIKFTTTEAKSNAWDSQTYYDLSAPLVKGEAYTLTAKMKSTQQDVSFGLWPIWNASDNRDQWGGSANVQYESTYNLSTEWKTYTWHFTANFTLDRLQFVFGSLNGSIYMDDIVLKADAVGVNCIINGDFSENDTKGWSKPGWHSHVSISIVDSDSDTTPEIKEPEIPETWEYVEQGDPNFHVYLCFGQSNMEGATQPEDKDYENVSERFKMMAAVDFTSPKRTKGEWYVATPPLCRQGTGLTPADYFGRKLVEKLPGIEVGVINVAVGGARIELYMEEKKDEYISGEAGWCQNICAQYDNDPLGRLIEMGKKAQKVGTIKGILLHQGESNCGQADWPEKVKKVYTRICYHLGLDPSKTPLLAGECLYENQGGGCSWHNVAALSKLPSVLPNSYVISADGITGNGKDPWHFSAKGYRQLGERYADKMLELLGNTVSVAPISVENNVSDYVYDLSGRLCKETPACSLYITQGKKFIVKR